MVSRNKIRSNNWLKLNRRMVPETLKLTINLIYIICTARSTTNTENFIWYLQLWHNNPVHKKIQCIYASLYSFTPQIEELIHGRAYGHNHTQIYKDNTRLRDYEVAFPIISRNVRSDNDLKEKRRGRNESNRDLTLKDWVRLWEEREAESPS